VEGAVKVQGRAAVKSWRARAGDVITIAIETLDPSALPEPEAALDVRLEREDLVVVYKPAGQPTAPIQAGELGTLANALVGRYPEMAGVGYGPREPGILHRLDTHTSGLVLAARTAKCFDVLSRALREGTLHKEYLLICELAGLVESGIIDIPIGVEGKQSRRVVACVRPEEMRRCNPKPARTSYRILERHGRWALVLAEAPKAMRHQLRAHFAAIEHPLAGDALYGGDTEALSRHALHARLISYVGSGAVEAFEVSSEMPEDMAGLLKEAAETLELDAGQ
jgi:23S rRNA pseudouridine1911/1915/1917 synthase